MISFTQLNQRYLAEHLGSRESFHKYTRIYKQYFSTWENHPTRFQLFKFHQSITAKHHANCAIGYIKAMYNWAMRTPADDHRAIWEAINPAYGIKRHTVYSRERVMDIRELKLLLGSIDMIIDPMTTNRHKKKYHSEYLDGVRKKYHAWFICRLLVPCRIKELCHMRWRDINEHGRWDKPPGKNGRNHTIHIARQALELILGLPRTCEYVFPGHYDKPISQAAIRKMWTRWRSDMGIKNLYVLDFRRTLATYLYDIMKDEVDELVAKAILNHYDSRPTAIYVKLNYDRLANIIQGYADWIDTFREGGHHVATTRLATASDTSTRSSIVV